MSSRILEPEVMWSPEEADAYEKITLRFMHIVHDGAVQRALALGPSEGRYLDLGTGTGWIAVKLAKFNPGIRVFAIEMSPPMLGHAQRNAASERVVDRTCWLRGNAKQVPLPDRSMDMVVCHNMLHQLPEPLDLLREIKRVLKPTGGLLLRDLIRPPDRLIPFHLGLFGFQQTPLMRKEYADSIRAAFSLAEWKDLMRTSGLGRVTLKRHFITHMSMERAATNAALRPPRIPGPLWLRPARSFYLGGITTR